MEGQEVLRTDLTHWTIGPYHGGLPGPMRLRLRLDGEIIVAAEVETGFLHKGLEKAFEKQLWQSGLVYADRVDPEGASFGELAFCLAVEEIASLEVPARAKAIRVIACELSRISSHFAYIARVARAVGSETMFHYVLRDREKILDLFELLTGARFSTNFLRFGGVASDVTEGFIERVLEACDLIRLRLKEYNDLLTYNHAFMRRTSGIAVLTAAQVGRLGMSGPNARASGVGFDVRRGHAYCGYDALDFEVPVISGEPGDAHGRFLLRLREVDQSVEILRQVVDALPTGPYDSIKVTHEFKAPAGEGYSRIESSRGLMGCHVVSDGGLKPTRVHFRTPSIAGILAIPELLPGARLGDLPVVLASLDIVMAEVDR